MVHLGVELSRRACCTPATRTNTNVPHISTLDGSRPASGCQSNHPSRSITNSTSSYFASSSAKPSSQFLVAPNGGKMHPKHLKQSSRSRPYSLHLQLQLVCGWWCGGGEEAKGEGGVVLCCVVLCCVVLCCVVLCCVVLCCVVLCCVVLCCVVLCCVVLCCVVLCCVVLCCVVLCCCVLLCSTSNRFLFHGLGA